jgi:cation:H+ antiporter
VGGLGVGASLVVFAAAAAATWIAGVALSKTTNVLDRRLGLGDALGGLILLALAGTLPEVAITVSGAARGNLDLAAGNLIGGIAVQTMVLALCDVAVRGKRPLSYLVGSLVPVLEALLVVLVVGGVLLGALLPASVSIGPVSPASIAIVLVWLGGLFVIRRAQQQPRWEASMPGSRPGRPHRRVLPSEEARPSKSMTPRRAAALFALASLVTLAAGVALEETGNTLADRAGINGVAFGATVLAVATALPEISSGIAAVRFGDHRLAVSDIYGGNAFQVCLFLVADLIAAKPVLPAAGRPNSWVGALGIALTAIYAAGVIVRPRRRIARLGADSLLALVVFALGIAGLFTIVH